MKFIYTCLFVILPFARAAHSKSFTGNDDLDNSFDIEINPLLDDNSNVNNDRSERSDNEKSEDEAPQCGVMFRNNEPVGILQPFEDSYKFLPVNGDATIVDINPVQEKKKSIMDVLYPANVEDYENYDDTERSEDKVGYFDEKYPSIFAKFKIDSRMDIDNKKRSMTRKRNVENDFGDKFGTLKSTLSRIKNHDSEAVEEELKNILDDMGLIDDYPQDKEKREAEEDEDLEMGTNRISLVKERHNMDKREKRQELSGLQSAIPIPPVVEDVTKPPIDIAKILYELTTSSGAMGPKFKRHEKRENEDDIEPYEKRVEREIRDKIEKLKDEVKKEIDDLRAGKSKKINDDSIRKKRQTLIDEETKDIDPLLAPNEDNQKSHVRRKKNNKLIGRSLKSINNNTNNRTKREVQEVLRKFDDEENNPGEDYSAIADDNEQNNFDSDFHCQCDKDGNNCKCNKPLTSSDTPERVVESCHCENGHCSCDVTKQNSQKSVENKRAVKRTNKKSSISFENGEYFVDLHPDVYRLTPAENKRRKRESMEELIAIHGGEGVRNHLVSIRQRSMLPHSRYRRRIQKNKENKNEERKLTDMSDEELFGALPQSFEGELQRYKRVKRREKRI